LGLIPQDAPLAALPETMRKWESLTVDEKQIYAKAMAVYSGMIEAMDHHIGRLVEHVKAKGELDNTIFIVTSDNGPEPSDPVHATGMNIWMALNGYHWNVDTLGEKGSLAFIGPEWAASVSSPSKLFKFYTTEGGLRVPFVIAGPGITPAKKQAPAFVTDVTPTILDFAGVAVPPGENEIALTGRSLRGVLEGVAERTHPEDAGIGVEVAGNAALFKGDYKIVKNSGAHGDDTWRLYNLATDPGETKDLSQEDPTRLAGMTAAYKAYTEQMGVLPMPDGYNVQRQVAKNALAKQLSFYWWILALMALALVGVAWTAWRLIARRIRRA
jgi:arylsulfatase A-like enzyme